ncbi:MAG: carboxypeptidase-like regulatory domain-containing protein [Bacteroidota bacterium]
MGRADRVRSGDCRLCRYSGILFRIAIGGCILSFVSSANALAQSPTLEVTSSFTGTVTNQNNEPSPGIAVLLKNTTKGAVTDIEGKFSITEIQPGTYTIKISGVGYEKQEFRITFKAAQKLTRSFTLKESTSQLDEVIVTEKSEAQELRLSAKAVQVIETREAKLKAADLGEVLSRTEGVSVQRGGGLGSNERFALNGLSGDQIRFFYNHIPLQFSPYNFGVTNVPVNRIDRVEIYKGVVPIEFGADALGGAVNLIPPAIYDGFNGSASYQFGSFNTHRFTTNISLADDNSGLFALFGGFYDYTDNNYKIDVAVPNERGDLSPYTVERFHDGYTALGGNLKLGIRNKSWARHLSIEGYYGEYEKEVQNSQAPGLLDLPTLGINEAVGGRPFGELLFSSVSGGLNLDYGTELGRLDIELRGGYNYNERVSLDTSQNLYNWFGEVVRVQNFAGEFAGPDNLVTTNQSYFLRQQTIFNIAKNHQLKLAIAPTYSFRSGDDLLLEGPFDPALDRGFLLDIVSGLEYKGDFAQEKLQLILFAKNYIQDIRIESLEPSIEQELTIERQVSNYGAGTALRYNWTSNLALKMSYEFAYRMPRPDELFGDGFFIFRNFELLPENSHNYNLQWSLKNSLESLVSWQIEGNLFLRQTDNLIFLLVNDQDFGSYENVWSATSRGFEFGGKVKNLIRDLNISLNATYQDYLNTSDIGPFEDFEGDRLPNRPYFFANFNSDYKLSELFKSKSSLYLYWSSRYVHSFFLGWESVGLLQSKSQVPSQAVHGTGITHKYKFGKVQLSTTIEVANLTNAKVFDFFGVQRPGRAFYIKSTIQF